MSLVPWSGINAHVPSFEIKFCSSAKGIGEPTYCTNRIDRPRFTMTGKVWSTFYPACFTFFNCRCGKLFLRKWRGLRARGRHWQERIRQRKREERQKVDRAINEAFIFLGWKDP